MAALVAGLSTAAQVPITATVIHAETQRIPDAAEQAHELLDMVHRLECPPGLHSFDELAMEYQLTRPGPGREYLGTLLDPLDEYPELLETLRRHIGNDLVSGTPRGCWACTPIPSTIGSNASDS